MSDAPNNIGIWFRNVAFGLICAAVGWLANQYMDYRSSYRDALETNYESFNSVAREIEQSLKHFADISRGIREKQPQDVEALQMKLLSAVTVANDLQRRIGADQTVVERYKVAAVDLQRASEQLSGPLDGKEMVMAVSQYLFAEQQLRDAVIAERNSFF